MEKFSSTVCNLQTKPAILLLVLFFSISLSTRAQNRNFGFIFSENMHGGTTLFGNSLLNVVNQDGTPNITAMNGNSVNGNSMYDNGGLDTSVNMQYIDIDGNTGDGAGTRNSSSSDLVLPTGANTIRLARLYWGGRASTAEFDMTKAINQKIKIRKGTSGAYLEFSAAQINKYIINTGLTTEYCHYQAYVDITDLVKQQGQGTYTVANGAFSTGKSDNFGNYGGWGIVIVYENPALDFNSVRVVNGYQEIYTGGNVVTSTVTLTGLNVPSAGLTLSEAKIGIMGWEGDSRYTGDFFKINNISFNNSLNQINNPWNGTITNNGVHVVTKNPNYTDQMSIDIDQADIGVGYGILPNASSLILQLGTTQDQFFCGVITCVVKMKAQVIQLTKTVSDANDNNTAEAAEILTYKLKGKNIGGANATLAVLVDSLPSTMTYLVNSLNVNYGPGANTGIKTDVGNDDIAEYIASNNTVTFRLGSGADAVNGGVLVAGDSFEVQFKVIVNTPVNGNVPPIINVARLTASAAGVYYVDDATAVISPPAFILSTFTANLLLNNQVKLEWSTLMEFNSSRFNIERSTDNINFNTIATIAASGNSSAQINYFMTDDITAVNVPIIYYRLKLIGIDENSNTSKVVSVNKNKPINNFTVFPNPFRNNISINIEWDANETTVVKVFNSEGKEVFSKKTNIVKGLNYITLDELSQVPAGNYIIQFNTANKKLIKQVIKQ